MNIKVGDYYIRHSDGRVCRIKNIAHRRVVLESEDGTWLTLIDISGLPKAYRKKESKPTQ
jgi:hypothetical protein